MFSTFVQIVHCREYFIFRTDSIKSHPAKNIRHLALFTVNHLYNILIEQHRRGAMAESIRSCIIDVIMAKN
jgi:hypothetical protein